MNEELKQNIFADACELGFTLAGVSEPEINNPSAFTDWLEAGNAAAMSYMSSNLEKRLDPKKLVPGVQSILCLAVNYFQKTSTADIASQGQIARYAIGQDYHIVVREMLHNLADKISGRLNRKIKYRAFVDTGPVLEKILAAQAGLGWIGKNSCLINEQYGSFLFLGELFLDFELPPDTPAKDNCSQCRKCIDACPTGAIANKKSLDARLCLSYQTIENKDEIPAELKSKITNQLFGCDICQDACPFNQRAIETQIKAFTDHKLGRSIDPAEILAWTEEQYKSRTKDSAGNRASLAQWQRNAQIILTNQNRQDEKPRI